MAKQRRLSLRLPNTLLHKHLNISVYTVIYIVGVDVGDVQVPPLMYHNETKDYT